MDIKAVGLDIGKSSFHLIGTNQAGKPVYRHKFNRVRLIGFMAKLPSCVVGMEACPGSQHLARQLERYGHEVRLIAPKFIKPYLKSQKNDFNDAEAIAEAVLRPTMRFVPVKSPEQLDVQAMHRIRERLIRQRTSIINQIRAFLLESGLPVKVGRKALRRELPGILEDAENALTVRMRALLAQLREHWQYLEQRIEGFTAELEAVAKAQESGRHLLTIPGVGALGATALISAIGNGAAFRRGRDLAAWLGLVPRQHSTGGKARLLGISKRGNCYLRKLLIHGARSLVNHMKREQHALGAWISQLEQRAHRNIVIVALANKLARIAWAVLAHAQPYRASPASAVA